MSFIFPNFSHQLELNNKSAVLSHYLFSGLFGVPYHSFSDEPYFYYSTTYDAMNLTDYNKGQMATSHYFTIIGYVRYFDDDGNKYYK